MTTTEYISTLELDIAERDRLLEAIRTELGTSLSENVALRQEIAALKRGLLDGRGTNASSYQDATSNLPPPAPLPEKSAADMLALREQQQQQLGMFADFYFSMPLLMEHSTASSSNLLRPNTQKDLPNSNTGANGSAFWGGAAAGGVLPVHTAFVPSVASGFANMGRMSESTSFLSPSPMAYDPTPRSFVYPSPRQGRLGFAGEYEPAYEPLVRFA